MAKTHTGTLVRVLLAWALSSTVQWAGMVALGVYAHQRDGAWGVAAVTVARLAPAMLAAPVAGLLVDRLDRVLVALVACTGRTLAVTVAAAVVLIGGSVVGVVAATAAIGVLGVPIRPALRVVLPTVAGSPAALIRATAVWGAADNGGFLVGAGLGGLLIAATGPGPVLGLSALAALIGTLLVVGLPSRRAAPVATDDGPPGALADLAAGLRVVLATRALHAPFLLFGGLLVLEGATDVQLVSLAIDRLHLGPGGPGLLYGAWGVGGMVAGPVLLVVVRRWGYGRGLVAGAVVFGLLVMLCGLGGAALAVTAMLPAGLGFTLVEGALMGVLPRVVDDAVLGRLYGVCELLYAGVAALGALLAAPLMAGLGIRGSLVALGGAYAVLGLLAWRPCLRLDRGERVASRVRELLHGVPFLRPLPLPQLERLVRAAQPVAAAPGTAVVTLGEPGEDFYVVDTGEVAVVEYGRTAGPGVGFGEIALLRDVPRTATVRATRPTTLWAVPRSAFLAAVGADGEVGTAADAVVSDHLIRPRVDTGD